MDGTKQFDNAAMDVECQGDILMESIKKEIPSRQDSFPLLFTAINAGNLEGVRQHLDQTKEHINSTAYGGLTPLHAACHMQQLDILRLLIERGAKIDALDSLGNSPLHVAAREDWLDGINELLQHGASPSQMSDPPGNVSGQLKETPLHAAIRIGNIKIFTMMMKYKPDLSVRDRNNQSVFHLAAGTRSVAVMKHLLLEPQSKKLLENMSENTESLYHASLPPSAKAEHEPQILKVLQLIYRSNDDINIVNFLGETPLGLACKLGLPIVVKFFLDNGADPTKVNREGQTTLHAACMSGCSATLQNLLNTTKVQDLISQVDNSGFKPFYYAVESGSIQCCKTLLLNGEHLTNIGKNGKNGMSNCSLVLEKLPSAMQLFRDLFDSSVTISKKSQYDPDFSITFDYSVLVSSEREDVQSSIASELAGTRLESLIKHPLLESFLYIKWSRIRNVFYLNVLQYFLYLILHTVFVLLTFGNPGIQWTDHHKCFMFFKISHIVLILSISVPALIMTLANFKKILMQWETYTRVIAMTTSAYVIFITTERKMTVSHPIPKIPNEPVLETERALASVAILFVWVELMMLLGRFPALGTYILMFTKVTKSLIKFILAFLSLILGFSMSFYILFQNMPVFQNYGLSFAKTVIMMTGEIAYSEFVNEENMAFSYFCLVIMCLFVFLVTVVMSNLLIGLAVNDIPYLKRLGKIKRLVKQASYLVAYEKVLTFVYNAHLFPESLRALMSSRHSIKVVITISPNKEKKRGKYSRQIKDETLREAMMLGNCVGTDDFQSNIEDDVTKQLKSFQTRYASDRKTQKRKFEELAIMCGHIKKDMTKMETKIVTQMENMHSIMEQIFQQNQNLLRTSSTK